MTELWFRCYCDLYRNRKLRNVSETFQLRYMWFLALHKEGKLVGAPISDIAWELRLTEQEVSDSLSALIEARLLLSDRTPKGWGDRQYVSDNSTGRVKKHREVKRFRNVSETPSETETETETETEAERARPREARPGRIITNPRDCSDLELIAPTEKQMVMLHDKAGEAGTTLDRAAAALGLPVAGINVGRLKAHLEALIAERRSRASPETFAQAKARRTNEATANVLRRIASGQPIGRIDDGAEQGRADEGHRIG